VPPAPEQAQCRRGRRAPLLWSARPPGLLGARAGRWR
jgi:hypothetical protein